MTIAERIYSASTSEEAKTARLAERLARQIEDDIASNKVPPGGAMGSLRELSERYCAGRAAAREAVALLERRGLGRLRPGPCGGFIVTEPECHAIAAELASYFRTAGVTLAQLKDARDALDPMVARLAAAEPYPAWRLETLRRPGSGPEWYLRLQAELARLAGEPVLELFVLCLNDLTADFIGADETGEAPSPSWDGAALRRALLDGDMDAAATETEALRSSLELCLQEEALPHQLPAITRHADDRTLSTFVARKLAAEVLTQGNTGQRLGSEWDLCERYSVSRATLRQAIRQLQDSGLVEGRRGRGNGLVVRDLRATGSIRLVLAFLIGRQMDPMAAGTILFQLNRFVPVLAMSRASEEQRAKLAELLDGAQRQDPIDRYDLLRLVQCVSELSDSPIVDLFSRCLAAYEARFHPFLLERLPAPMQAEYFALLRNLLEDFNGNDAAHFARAKEASSRVLLEMSHSRPL